jgi:hypothetical protein
VRTKATIVLAAAFAVYLFGYAVLRCSNYEWATIAIPLPTSDHTRGLPLKIEHHSATSIVIPAKGIGRPVNLALYWAYYLPGQADQALTRRLFINYDYSRALIFP